MANTVGFAFGKEEVVASSPPQVLLMKDLIWKFSSKIKWVDEGEDFIQREVFQALPEGKRS